MPSMAESQQTFLARVTDAAVADDRVFACWTEGDSPQACFPPFAGAVDLHIGTPEPFFEALAADHVKLLSAGGKVVAHRDADAPVNARTCAAEMEGGLWVALTIERLSLLAKRPRAFIAPLVDKTQQLRYVMDYSKRPSGAEHGFHG